MKFKTLVFCGLVVTLGACASTIKLTEEGKKVRVLEPGEVASCRKIGNTNTSVTWAIAGIERPEEAVGADLRKVASNSAARMGGDTIVPLTVIDRGEQTFVVYKCVNPDG